MSDKYEELREFLELMKKQEKEGYRMSSKQDEHLRNLMTFELGASQ